MHPYFVKLINKFKLNPEKYQNDPQALFEDDEEEVILKKAEFSKKLSDQIAKKLNVTDLNAFHKGINIELEHKDVTKGDPILTGKIARAHLKENPKYYDLLEKYVEKDAMYAPGILDKSNKPSLPNVSSPTLWEFVIQEHIAKKAGRHYDIRLGDPSTGHGYSWATKSEIPQPGGKILLKEQPVHTIDYFDFQGEIKDGYGAGSVKTIFRDKVEVLKSTPDKITFYIYSGTPQKYTFIKTSQDDWLMINHTINQEQLNYFATGRPKYKDHSYKYKEQPGDFKTPKIDGAYGLTILKAGKSPVVFGHRTSSKTGLPIEYTPKIPGLISSYTPKELGTTVLRTEVFATNSNNEEIPNRVLGGILNSGVFKSRSLQKELGTNLRLAATDVIKYKGKDVSNLDIQAKYNIIDEISKVYPYIENPIKLNNSIDFKEGSVVWRNGVPLKVKNKPDYDVYVQNIFPDKNNRMAGGIEYSLKPDGPIVGRVGTGWEHSEKIDMLDNPQDYIGRVAKVYAQEQHPSGALRAPSFNTWHLDK